MFLVGWLLALALVSSVAYVLADQGNASTGGSTSDAIAFWELLVASVSSGALSPGHIRARRPSD